MSADKHKKKARAFAMLRERRGIAARWGKLWNDDGRPMDWSFSGRPSPEMLWLVKQGLARIVRPAARYAHHIRNRRNRFEETC